MQSAALGCPSWKSLAVPAANVCCKPLQGGHSARAGGRQCRHADAPSALLTGATWLQGVSGAAPVALSGMPAVAGAAIPPASFVDAGHLAASWEVSPRMQAVLVSLLAVLLGSLWCFELSPVPLPD